MMDYIDWSPTQQILTTFYKGSRYLEKNLSGTIVCAISGGSDSDIMLDIVYKLDIDKKVRYVFFDTGIEYRATMAHLDNLEKKYNIKIERVPAKKTVPVVVRELGVPFLSKYVSEMLNRLQKNGFKWEAEAYEQLILKYPNCKTALKWWCNGHDSKSSFNIKRHKYLKEFIMENPPIFKISNKCCTYAKKLPSSDYCKKNNVKLLILGIRQAESGIRSTIYKNCYDDINRDGYAVWRPLFWFTDEDKLKYCEHNGVKHSQCYTDYRLTRTGCFGCPFGSKFEQELVAMEKFEPITYIAANNIFKDAYEYTRRYRAFKNVIVV